MSLDEFKKRWKLHFLGLALEGWYYDHGGSEGKPVGPMQKWERVAHLPEMIDKLLTNVYNDITKRRDD